ncbi:hypothetical protein C8F01DRAFT_749622 [Mycena amicta]|nr:hypothetical protein C8F01DRAFT_749622 [Mycena amicta]
MPSTYIPDEIISEILSPALKVDDVDFSATSEISPFAQHSSESSSAHLLVCKAWLRVSTPLLYSVVVLRSTAQAKALSSVVARNNQLGTLIRKLRVEGGYGAAMHTLLKYTPNITDLFLSFDIVPRDSTDGLCKGLSLINPVRLILLDPNTHKLARNDMVSKLTDALVQVGPNWKALTVLDISSPRRFGQMPERIVRISEAIAREARLSTIVVGSVGFAVQARDAFKACPLKVIRISIPVDWQPELDSAISLQGDLAIAGRTVLQYEIECRPTITTQPDILPSMNPNFTPMSSVPSEIQDSIWSRIFEFTRFHIRLLLVCKSFYRLALPQLYALVVLSSRPSASKLARTTIQSPTHAMHIRKLYLSYCVFDNQDENGELPTYDDPIWEILHNARALEIFASNSCTDERSSYLPLHDFDVSWDALKQVAQTAGGTLRKLCVNVEPLYGMFGTGRRTPVVFNNFSSLTKLTWRSPSVFHTDLASAVYQDAFPCLEELQIWEIHDSLVNILALMKLPSLKHLTILTNIHAHLHDLFEAHGNDLTTLHILIDNLKGLLSTSRTNRVLHLCPNLTDLTILCGDVLEDVIEASFPASQKLQSTRFPSMTMFHSATPARMLTKIKFRIGRSNPSKWEAFFKNFYTWVTQGIPNLQEVQLASSFDWPVDERNMVNNPWVRTAERLLAVGVQVSDHEGIKWRSRLSTKRPERTMTTRANARQQNGNSGL